MQKDKRKTGSLTTSKGTFGKVPKNKMYITISIVLWVVAMLDFILYSHQRPVIYVLITIGIPLVTYTIIKPNLFQKIFPKKKSRGRNSRRSRS